MTTAILARPISKTGLLVPMLFFVLGMGIISASGHVQASALHDAAHDVRHATGFPCH